MVSSEAEGVRITAAGSTQDEAMATLPGLYDGSRWATRGTARAYAFRYAALGDEAMTLRTSSMSGQLRGEVPPSGDYVVQWILHGSAVVDVGAADVPLRLGSPMLFPAHRPFVFDFTDYDQKLVHLGRSGVDAMVEEHYGTAPADLRFDHRPAPSPAAAATFLDTVALASRTLRRGPVAPLLWHELTRLTTAAFLGMYPPAAAPAEGGHATAATRIRQVLEHIHASAALPLTPAALARVADVSVRTLQESFARHVGATPMAYVRGVRLDRVREALLAAEPGTTTVAGIAREWGFAHLGRFSAEYRRRFGELPSDTLRG